MIDTRAGAEAGKPLGPRIALVAAFALATLGCAPAEEPAAVAPGSPDTSSADSAPASPGPRREVVATTGAPAAIGPYSQAIRRGDELWVAGQIGLDPSTGELVEGGIEAEARRALDNLRAIVEAAGFSLGDVVACQVFLADIGDYARFNAVYSEYFPLDPPARAVVQVAALPLGARVEVMATAVGSGG